VPAERPAMVSTSAGERRAWLSFMEELALSCCEVRRRRRGRGDNGVEAQNIFCALPRLRKELLAAFTVKFQVGMIFGSFKGEIVCSGVVVSGDSADLRFGICTIIFYKSCQPEGPGNPCHPSKTPSMLQQCPPCPLTGHQEPLSSK